MPSVKELTRSFAGGEITPEMFGRLDNVKFQTGLALCQNAIVLPHGSATKRPGFSFVNIAGVPATAVRLIAFAWSASQTMVLEFGAGYIRFHTQGATLLSGGSPYQLTSPYSAGDLFDLEYTQSADVVTITHPSYAARELRRLSATNWTLTVPSLGSALAVPTISSVTPTAGAGTPYNKDIFYKITTVSADGTEESLASTSGTATIDLSLQGAKNTIAWGSTGGGVSYRVYKAVNTSTRLYGFIGETVGLTFVDDNITPDYSYNPPNNTIRLDTPNNYPAAVTYFEQRRMFAGTNSFPQTVYGTRNGTESNLNTSQPSSADDALSFTIKAQQQNAIRHLVALNDLVALTAGGAWKIGSPADQPLAPDSVRVRPQAFYGANNVRPLLTGISCLYVEANGRRVRDLAFSWQSQVYASEDRSVMAPHLFQGYTLVDAAYSRSPDQLAWFVRSDGVLLGMSYVPEQQVFGWHQHTTSGAFESVCVVAENNEDVLYVVVRRTLNGTTTRTIERMATRLFSTQADAFFVDCGATYSGAPAATISGLTWLVNMPVVALADGAVVSNLTVSATGTITLPIAASKVNVGLAYSTNIQTLPLSIESMMAGGQGTTKSIDYAYLRVYRTGVVKVGPNEARLTTVPPRTNEPYDSPPRLRSEVLDLLINPDISQDAQLWIQSSDPTPLTVSSLTTKVTMGG
jgi:hypothetical protein